MLTNILNIATIQNGIYLKPEPFGEALYLQIKDFNTYGNLIEKTAARVQLPAKTNKHLLQSGDVLVIAKGSRNTAYTYNGKLPAFASSTFLVLRLSTENTDKILPEFLAWYINTPQMQASLCNVSRGTIISSLSVPALGNMQISVPPIFIQEKILKVNQLSGLEQSILNQLSKLKHQYTQQLLINSFK